MKITVLPENFLRCMSDEERKALGKSGMTMAEAQAKYEAKCEREMHETFEAYLRLRDHAYRHDRMDKKTTGTVGWPDFTFAIAGNALAVEFKVPGKFPTGEQLEMIGKMRRDGWEVCIAHSVLEAIDWVEYWRKESKAV